MDYFTFSNICSLVVIAIILLHQYCWASIKKGFNAYQDRIARKRTNNVECQSEVTYEDKGCQTETLRCLRVDFEHTEEEGIVPKFYDEDTLDAICHIDYFIIYRLLLEITRKADRAVQDLPEDDHVQKLAKQFLVNFLTQKDRFDPHVATVQILEDLRQYTGHLPIKSHSTYAEAALITQEPEFTTEELERPIAETYELFQQYHSDAIKTNVNPVFSEGQARRLLNLNRTRGCNIQDIFDISHHWHGLPFGRKTRSLVARIRRSAKNKEKLQLKLAPQV